MLLFSSFSFLLSFLFAGSINTLYNLRQFYFSLKTCTLFAKETMIGNKNSFLFKKCCIVYSEHHITVHSLKMRVMNIEHLYIAKYR